MVIERPKLRVPHTDAVLELILTFLGLPFNARRNVRRGQNLQLCHIPFRRNHLNDRSVVRGQPSRRIVIESTVLWWLKESRERIVRQAIKRPKVMAALSKYNLAQPTASCRRAPKQSLPSLSRSAASSVDVPPQSPRLLSNGETAGGKPGRRRRQHAQHHQSVVERPLKPPPWRLLLALGSRYLNGETDR